MIYPPTTYADSYADLYNRLFAETERANHAEAEVTRAREVIETQNCLLSQALSEKLALAEENETLRFENMRLKAHQSPSVRVHERRWLDTEIAMLHDYRKRMEAEHQWTPTHEQAWIRTLQPLVKERWQLLSWYEKVVETIKLMVVRHA